MFWKLVKYELQSVHKWYLGIYGIAILLIADEPIGEIWISCLEIS